MAIFRLEDGVWEWSWGMGMRGRQNSNKISQDTKQQAQQQPSAPSEHICFMIEIMINERAAKIQFEFTMYLAREGLEPGTLQKSKIHWKNKHDKFGPSLEI